MLPENQIDPEALPCSDKLRFATKREAVAAATVASHQHGAKLKAYLCGGCGWWHLASK